jgi:phage terminase large subunit-like protein
MVVAEVTSSFEEFATQCGLTIESFQRRIRKAMDGPEREAVILVPRGQGKTALAALDALRHFVTTEEAQVYCCASARDQADILFEFAAKYARRLDHPNIVFRHRELRWCPDPDNPKVYTRHMRVLPAKDAGKLHGLTFTRCYLDELQAFSDDAVYIALNSALHKQPTSKLIVISTAGQGADSPLGRLRARALAQPKVTRRGVVTEAQGPDLRFLEWSLSEDDDVDDPRAVKRCNPASWISVDQLRAARESLPDLAHRRFVANMWTEREGFWLPEGAYQKVVGKPKFTDGEDLWVGCDVGGQRARSAVAWLNESLNVGVGIFEGDHGVIDCLDLIRELAGKHNVRTVAYDPWRFGQGAQELQEAGIQVEAVPQTDARMIPASAALHAAIVDGELVLPDDEELAQHAANTIARHSRRGWRIDKPDDRTPNDAVIALCLALDALQNQPPPTEFLGWM